jgi:hypothetical protein
MEKRNKHLGSNIDDFLKEAGIFKEVQAHAMKRVALHAGSERILNTPAMRKSIRAGMKESLAKSSKKLPW